MSSGADDSVAQPPAPGGAVLWQDPGDIGERDLYYGSGGREREPQPPFTFLEEDLDGTNPKFDVRDGAGIKWTVKLGIEARPEVAASRLVWAVGYFTRDNYYLPRIVVENMPKQLERGQEYIAPDGAMYGVRLKRSGEHERKIGYWRWKENPFSGTKELNGLRAMMSLIANLDLKDSNTGIMRTRGVDGVERDVYLINDLGCSFSKRKWPDRLKGNLDAYRQSRFIEKINENTVDFSLPKGPGTYDLYHLSWHFHSYPMRWLGKGIPIQDVRWIGALLGRLSPEQVRSAFRAAGFSEMEVDGFSEIILKRISDLGRL